VPWELYDRYRIARAAARGGPDAVGVNERLVRSLLRWERFWLGVVCVAPFGAGAALYAYRTAFPHYERFLTNINIALFVMSALARPLNHLLGNARSHAVHLHQAVVYPQAEVAALSHRVAVLEHQIALLQGRTATHEELEDVQEVLKPMMTHLMTSVKELDARTDAIVRQADSRLALVERSLGLVPVADGTSALAQLQWALIRVGRGLVAAFVSPVVLPIQLAMTTWDVVTRPLRSVVAPAAVKEAPVPAAAASATGHRRSSRGDSLGSGDARRRSAAHAPNGEPADGGGARIGGPRTATQ